MLPGLDSDPELLHILDWYLLDFEPTLFRIQLSFENPLYLSKNSIKDDLSIVFINPDYFIAEMSYEIIKNHTLLTK